MTVDVILDTVRGACDSIEDNACDLGPANALKLLKDLVMGLQKEVNGPSTPSPTKLKRIRASVHPAVHSQAGG